MAPKRKGELTYFVMPAGDYVAQDFYTLQYSYNFPDPVNFTVTPKQVVYIGDINFMTKLRYAADWKVEAFSIKDKSDELPSSEFTKKGYALVSTATHQKKISDETVRKLKVPDKTFSPQDLEGSGLIVAMITVNKRTNSLLAGVASGLTLGLKKAPVDSFTIDFTSSDRLLVGSLDNSGWPWQNHQKLDKYSQGKVAAVLAPPGDYNISGFHVTLTDGSYIYSIVEADATFSVQAGEVVYIGEYFANVLQERFLGVPQPQEVEFYVNDYWARDRSVLEKEYPFLKEVQSRVELCKPAGGWENIFRVGTDLRNTLGKKEAKTTETQGE
ncbi:hypothetical protein [Pelagicoccus enzymogenes]|uniref:hypothetical protein n=1 Tax=Pelagicoccus enzymogenes TaxID=2773457 RepID=UPI001CD772E8|nr:hypothetical protein [Pelagicoccus enzymogenes]